ncbi:MAG: XRE family transcriptional regulator [Oscillibacter sp.]|nr:XRE family transcriptional regulator [Oscillibacter sp.]
MAVPPVLISDILTISHPGADRKPLRQCATLCCVTKGRDCGTLDTGGEAMNAVGKNLKQLRQREKLTQDALAERLHVTRQAVSSWETGKTQPDIETLTALAEALHADVRELIYGPGREESYRRGQRKYAALAAICVAVLFIFCVLETVLRPFVQQICWETYDLMPWVWYALTVPSAAALAAGGLLMSGTALVVDLRLPSKRLRMMALIFGAVAIGYYLIFVIYCFGHRFIFLANIPGFVDWIKNMNYIHLCDTARGS